MRTCKRIPLGEVASIRGGKRLPAGEDFVTTQTPYPYIRARDIGGGKIEINSPVFLEEKVAKRLARYTVNKGDVCLTIVGANVGEMGVVPPYLDGANLTENAVKIVANEKSDQAFLKYALLDANALAQMKVLAGGAAQPKLGIYKIETIEIPCPPIQDQRRIAEVLSTYDELIANNRARIRTLDEMARTLYREWFVHFHFPGHENAKLVSSPLGEIPQGWEIRRLSEFVTTKYGYTESSSIEKVGPQYLRGMDINKESFIDWSIVPYCPIAPEDHDAYRLRVGDVVVIRMADPGKVGIVEQEVDAVFASYLIRVAPNSDRLSPYFLFYLMEAPEYYAYITGASTGTTRKSASAGVIADYEFVLPQKDWWDSSRRK